MLCPARPSVVYCGWSHWPHLGSGPHQRRQFPVEEQYCVPQRVVDNLFAVPLVQGLWTPNEVVEAN